MEKEVYDYLCKYHLGKEHLIKNQDLRKLFTIGSDKSMRKVIQNIREDKDYPLMVGSISGKSGGFYVCITEEEKEETINNIKHRANQMLRMTHVLEWKRNLEGQRMDIVVIDLRKIEQCYIKEQYKKLDFISMEEILDDYDESLSNIENLGNEIETLKEEIKDLKQDMEDNYRPIPYAEQVGVSGRDFYQEEI